MKTETIELLASIQRMAISGSQQTKLMIRHEIHAWENGDTWSTVKVYDGYSNAVFDSVVVFSDGDDAIPAYEQDMGVDISHRHSLRDQHRLLSEFVSKNRMDEVAA